MDFAEHLQILKSADGKVPLLALATVDIAYQELHADVRNDIKDALVAAAVPHWFDRRFLVALLDTSTENAERLLGQLRALTVVESFPARGRGAHNVHEATRMALREHLRVTDPEHWKTLSTRARAHVGDGSEPHTRIEALYHLFAIDQTAAAAACELLDREFPRGRPEFRYALALALAELTSAGWLTGAAQIEALVAQLKVRVWRGEAAKLETDIRHVIDLARDASYASGLRRASYLLGVVLLTQGRLDDAAVAFNQAIALCEDRARTDPSNISLQMDLSAALMGSGDVSFETLELDNATIAYGRSLDILRHAGGVQPSNGDCQRELAVAWTKVAEIDRAQERFDDAMTSFRQALGILRRLSASDPANNDWERELSATLTWVGEVAQQQGNLDEAFDMFKDALAMAARLAEIDPTNFEWQRDLAIGLMHLGAIHTEQRRFDDALAAFEHATAILEGLLAIDASNAMWQHDLALVKHHHGLTLEEKGHEEEAQKSHRAAVVIMTHALEMSPGNRKWIDDLDNLKTWLPS